MASLNAFGRMTYSLGRYGLPAQARSAPWHLRHQTPHMALACGAILNFVLCVAFVANGTPSSTRSAGTARSRPTGSSWSI